MATALIYTRISTADQSNWSLSGQEQTAREYCARKDIAVVGVYSDEESGANFDRNGWRDLVAAIKRHTPTFVVCAKYDRISRSAGESLQLIQQIEERHGVRFVSAMEEIPISPHSPLYFQLRAQILVAANVELLVIRDRTAKGRYDAAKSGRFAGPAPYGYDNGRDENKKPVLVICEAEAAVVRQMYECYMAGMNFAEVKKATGYTGKNKGAVQRILTNPVYCGMVVVPAYAGSEAQIIRASHPAIVPESLFWQVQEMISGGTPKRHQADEAVPLRGFCLCQTCGKPITSSVSRGNGGRYSYYFCHRHKGPSIPAEAAHGWLIEVMAALSFQEKEIQVMRTMAEAELRKIMGEKEGEAVKVAAQIREAKARVDSLEVKLIDGVVNAETYRKWKPKLEADIRELEATLKTIESANSSVWAEFSRHLHLLGRLDVIYGGLSVNSKRQLLKMLFGDGLTLVQDGFRTKYIAPLFEVNGLKINRLQYEKETGTPANDADIPVCIPYGSILEPIQVLTRLTA